MKNLETKTTIEVPTNNTEGKFDLYAAPIYCGILASAIISAYAYKHFKHREGYKTSNGNILFTKVGRGN